MKFKFKQRGHFGNLEKLLSTPVSKWHLHNLDKYGEIGVEALSNATPVDTGLTARSWYYRIEQPREGITKLCFYNSNIADGWAPIAILLQYGHATRNGGWVEGIDYINPAIKPIFEKIAKTAWEEVTKR